MKGVYVFSILYAFAGMLLLSSCEDNNMAKPKLKIKFGSPELSFQDAAVGVEKRVNKYGREIDMMVYLLTDVPFSEIIVRDYLGVRQLLVDRVIERGVVLIDPEFTLQKINKDNTVDLLVISDARCWVSELELL